MRTSTGYPKNTIRWRKDAIVIHHADAKEPRMLMRVVGYTRDGLCKTQYVDKRRARTIWKNDPANLLDPNGFGMNSDWGHCAQDVIERIQENWELVRAWNRKYLILQRVKTTSADGGFQAQTTSEAYMRGSEARIRIQPGGEWSLKFIEPILVTT